MSNVTVKTGAGDIAVRIRANGESVLSPVSNRGRSMFPREIEFDRQQTVFLLPANLAHLEARGLTVELIDERSSG